MGPMSPGRKQMVTSTKDYNLTVEPGRAVLTGQFSLSNPVEFDQLFSGIRSAIEVIDGPYEIDLAKALFMSSSGITSLARVVLHAVSHEKRLVIKVDDSVLWQRKTVVALQNLWKGLHIERV
jgi:hypothetical protein